MMLYAVEVWHVDPKIGHQTSRLAASPKKPVYTQQNHTRTLLHTRVVGGEP